jgi:AcrR family transcriptional regulator
VGQTSLDEVMAASGVSKSQLYHYFADKDALVLDVIARQTERVLAAQRPHLEALDSLSALKAWRNAILRLNKTARGKG